MIAGNLQKGKHTSLRLLPFDSKYQSLHASSYRHECRLAAALILLCAWVANPVFARDHLLPQQPLDETEPHLIVNEKPLAYIKGHGFTNAELHLVRTGDNVTLEMHRIPCTPSFTGASAARQPASEHIHQGSKVLVCTPVLFIHGLLASSFDWIANRRNESFGFLAASAGYDVWLGNTRGNAFGVRSELDVPNFWTHDQDTSIQHDLPAQVDYILRNTSAECLHLVSHGQGGFIANGLLASTSKYNEKVCLHVSLAPVLHWQNVQNPVKFLATRFFSWMRFYQGGNFQFFSNRNYPSKLLLNSFVCSIVPGVCRAATSLMVRGHHNRHDKVSRYSVYTRYFPSGTAFRNIQHYLQTRQYGFAKFDYGFEINMERYGTPDPPRYRLESVEVPTVIAFACKDQDVFAAEPHNRWLEEQLDHTLYVPPIWVCDEGFEHMNFIWGVHAREILYDRLLELMKTRDHDFVSLNELV